MRSLREFLFGGTGFLLGLLVGIAVLGAFGYMQSGGSNVPYDNEHTRIANGFVGRDLTFSATMSLQHVRTAPIEFMPNSPMNVFPAHLQTTQSLWAFSSGNDVDVVMVIYGPGTDGESYLITFGKISPCAIEVVGWGRTVEWSIGAGQTIVIKP